MEHVQQIFGEVFGAEWGPALFLVTKNILLIVAIVLPLMLAVAYVTFAERKIIGYMQLRIGPNRVTFFGIPWLGMGTAYCGCSEGCHEGNYHPQRGE